MPIQSSKSVRVFQTAWFSKAARKGRITENELCAAILQVMLGQADDLGGGVFKKRLNKNRDRSIILAKGSKHWVFEYLFAKQDRSNIDQKELIRFRALAGIYETYTEEQVQLLLLHNDWEEICHDHTE
jgi:hypothetical protein